MSPQNNATSPAWRRHRLPLVLVLVSAGCCHAPKQAVGPDRVSVPSQARYTVVGRVVAGNEYTLSAEGRWIDWFICTDASGFESWGPLRWSENKRRHPGANWFALVGLVAADDRAPTNDASARTPVIDLSPYLGGTPWIAPADGILQVFANDLPSHYWNNKGAVTVSLSPR